MYQYKSDSRLGRWYQKMIVAPLYGTMDISGWYNLACTRGGVISLYIYLSLLTPVKYEVHLTK